MGLFSNFFGGEAPANKNEGEPITNDQEVASSPESVEPEETPKPEEEIVVDAEQNIARIENRLAELEGQDDPDSNAERAHLTEQLDMIKGMSGPKAY